MSNLLTQDFEPRSASRLLITSIFVICCVIVICFCIQNGRIYCFMQITVYPRISEVKNAKIDSIPSYRRLRREKKEGTIYAGHGVDMKPSYPQKSCHCEWLLLLRSNLAFVGVSSPSSLRFSYRGLQWRCSGTVKTYFPVPQSLSRSFSQKKDDMRHETNFPIIECLSSFLSDSISKEHRF